MNLEIILNKGDLCLSDLVVFKIVYQLLRKKKAGLHPDTLKLSLPPEIKITEVMFFCSLARLKSRGFLTDEGKGEHFDWLVTQMKLKGAQPAKPLDAPISVRFDEFRTECLGHADKFHPDMIEKFVRWWGEWNMQTQVMRWEKEDFFVIGMRLATWRDRNANK